MILPEVKDPKQWGGGHVFMDNVSGTRLFLLFHRDQKHRRLLVQYDARQAGGARLAG